MSRLITCNNTTTKKQVIHKICGDFTNKKAKTIFDGQDFSRKFPLANEVGLVGDISHHWKSLSGSGLQYQLSGFQYSIIGQDIMSDAMLHMSRPVGFWDSVC